jgi:hypothetical protein
MKVYVVNLTVFGYADSVWSSEEAAVDRIEGMSNDGAPKIEVFELDQE